MSDRPASPLRGTASRGASSPPAARRWFHSGVAGVLLLIVVGGFTPTFFLRSAFTDRPLPAYLVAHGVVLTVWFTLAFVQSVLVATRRTAVHRRLGIAGALTALALVPLSALVAVRAIARYQAAGVDAGEIQFIVIGDLISLVVFSGLVAYALVRRQDRERHRRFMTVASIMIVGPAIARLERLGFAVPVPAILLALLATIVVHDVTQFQRVHRATLVSVSIVLGSLGALLVLLSTDGGAALIAWLSPAG